MQNIPSSNRFSPGFQRARSCVAAAMVLASASVAAAANDAAPVVLPGESSASANAVSASDWFLFGPIQAGDPRFGVASQMPEAREWQEQDLVQIIVIEKSRSKIDQKRELETDGGVSAEVAEFSNFDFGAFNFSPATSSLPGVEIGAEKEFDGEGKYQRQDEMTDRITARIVEVKPNGNLVLEARVVRNWSGDKTEIRLTGITRPDWITASGTIASNQLYDLAVDKTHSGAVERSTQRGFIAEVLDFLFAF